MSRVVNAAATQEELVALCAQIGIGYSVVEPLKSGGTRLVLNNSADARTISARLKTKVIGGVVERCPSHVSRQYIPYL